MAEEDEQDWLNAVGFLAGYLVRNDRGINEIKYPEPKSREEKEARQSLAKLLRSELPLNYQLRQTLAALFDAEADTYPGGDRELVFNKRRPGRSRDHLRNSQIAEYIKGCMRADKDKAGQSKPRMSVDEAISEASAKFALGENMIWKIWNRFSKLDAPDERANVIFYNRVVREE
jgi:hypothetical protein